MASIDTTPSLVATNALQAIPFGSIIGAPLSACIEAQAKAAQTSWNFIKEVGLTDTEDGGKQAIYVNFEFRKNGRSTTLSVPLLTIVPIPYLAIKDIDISFKANISASASSSKTTSSSLAIGASMKATAKASIGIASASMEMSASISSKKDSTATRDSKYSVEYTMDVNVKAGQDDMPAGMAKVLEILNQSIDTIDSKGEISISEQNVRLVEGSGSTYVTYKNPDGYYDPKKLKVYTYTNGTKGEEATEKCKVDADELGALLTFSASGHYLVEGDESKAIVFVS
jgi:hypothetical protein